MHDSKLIRTLKTLDRKEQTDLNSFFTSGFNAINHTVVALLKYVLLYKPAFTSDQLSKETVFSHLFKGENYDDMKMRLLISDALKVVNQFIGVKMILSSPYEFEMLLLEHFNRSENNEFTLKRFDEFRKKLDEFPFRNEQYYSLGFRLETLRNNYHTKRSREYDLGQIFEMLEGFYFLNRLKMMCVRLSNHYIFRSEVDEDFISEIKETLDRKGYADNPITLGYSYALLLLTGEETGYPFSKLFELLDKEARRLSPYDQNAFSKILENHCIRQINSGAENYYDPLFILLERRLKRAEEISAGEVKTFVTLCLRIGRAETGKEFIDEKKNCIVPFEIRDDAFNYSMALLHFYQKNYDRVLLLLQQVEYVDAFYKIDSKKLLIETFYELKEWESLDSAMNAFRVFIHRNKEISGVHKKNNQNFINFLYKLVSAKYGFGSPLLQLQQQLKASKDVAERRWLIEKVKEKLDIK